MENKEIKNKEQNVDKNNNINKENTNQNKPNSNEKQTNKNNDTQQLNNKESNTNKNNDAKQYVKSNKFTIAFIALFCIGLIYVVFSGMLSENEVNLNDNETFIESLYVGEDKITKDTKIYNIFVKNKESLSDWFKVADQKNIFYNYNDIAGAKNTEFTFNLKNIMSDDPKQYFKVVKYMEFKTSKDREKYLSNVDFKSSTSNYIKKDNNVLIIKLITSRTKGMKDKKALEKIDFIVKQLKQN